MRKVAAAFAVLTVIALLAAGAAFVTLNSPYAAFTGPVLVEIPRGAGTRGAAEALWKAGAIRAPWHLLAAVAMHPGSVVQAGEYRFARADTPMHVAVRLAKGDVVSYELVVPEGQNIYDIAARVEELGFVTSADFLAAARDASAIKDLAPDAPSLEGFLFPSTYRLTRHATARQIARMMTDQFRRNWKAAGPAKSSALRTVTLASLIEKETSVKEERPIVASVFENRLANGMHLDCDPTTIYAALLEGRFRGTIYRSDLENKHRYNTYQNTGLPPGPIANPGLASLKAAIAPAESGYLYFVARGDASGGHRFAATLAEHTRNVSAYRKAIGR